MQRLYRANCRAYPTPILVADTSSQRSQALPGMSRLEALLLVNPELLWRQSLRQRFRRQSLGTRNTRDTRDDWQAPMAYMFEAQIQYKGTRCREWQFILYRYGSKLSGAENSNTDKTQDEKPVTFENSMRISMRSLFLCEAQADGGLHRGKLTKVGNGSL